MSFIRRSQKMKQMITGHIDTKNELRKSLKTPSSKSLFFVERFRLTTATTRIIMSFELYSYCRR
jgi:hypothetical protein